MRNLFLSALLPALLPLTLAAQDLLSSDNIESATWTQEPETVLPKPENLAGWHLDGKIDLYNPDNLYEYIDGAAEAYLLYGFQKLATCRFLQDKNDSNEITIDVYDMKTPLQAFCMYASESSPDLDFIPLGGQGHASDTFLAFWQAKFYIKMMFFGDLKDSKDILLDIAGKMSKSIQGNPPQPKFFSLFPEQGRVPHTEQILLKASLGHEFLAPAYQVSYQAKERPATVVVSVADTPEQASERFEKYREFLKKSKSPESPADGFPEGCLQMEDRYLGKSYLAKTGRYFILFVGEPLDGAKIMTKLLENLQDKKTP